MMQSESNVGSGAPAGSAASASASGAVSSSSAAPARPASASSASSSSSSASASRKKHVLKLILLGAAGSGKTALCNRFVDDSYHASYKATLGADMRDKTITVGDETVTLQIWDTAGQERFNSLSNIYLRGADMVLLCYDLTRADSFDALPAWRDQFLAATNNPTDFPFVCVGNKCDVAAQRAVSQRRANAWCQQQGDIPYIEASAKEGTNVRMVFMNLARRAVKKMQAERAEQHAASLAASSDKSVLPAPGAPGVPLGSSLKDLKPNKRPKQSNCC